MAEKKNIVIVGGGIQGCTTAYFLTRHPRFDPEKHSITLLEATSIAAGASGKAGGLLALWAYPSSLVPLSFRLHADLAKEHGGEQRWGYRRLNVGQINCDGHPISDPPKASVNGTAAGVDVKGLHSTEGEVAGNVSLQKRSQGSYANLQKKNVPDDLDWVDEDSIVNYDSMGSTDDTAQVHPYQFTTSMAKLAEEAGAKIFTGATVTEIKHSKSSGVESVAYTDRSTNSSHTIPCTDAVITAGPWTSRVWPGAPIGALRAHSVTLRPTDRKENVSPYALFTGIALPANYKPGAKSRAMTVTPEIYARPDHTLYACGEGDHLVPLPETADLVECDDTRCQDIVDHVSAVSNTLGTAEIVSRNACYLPQNEYGGSPLIGSVGVKGVWMAAGHTCWGYVFWT